jgi:Na+/H+ antiporter NhaC
MAFISYIGSSKFHGIDIIPYGWDFVVIIISALVFYVWGVRSSYRTKDLERLINNQEQVH